jgi:hypothetical protein
MCICWCIWFNLSQCFSLNATDQVSYPHKTKDNITVLHTWIFIFLDRTKEDNKNLDRIVEGIPRVQSQLIKFWSVQAEPKYLNLAILLYYSSSWCDSVLRSIHQPWTIAKFSQHLPLDKSPTTSGFFFTVLIFFSEIFLSYMGPNGTNHWSEGQLWQTIYPSSGT